jgi:hypothetical protein
MSLDWREKAESHDNYEFWRSLKPELETIITHRRK